MRPGISSKKWRLGVLEISKVTVFFEILELKTLVLDMDETLVHSEPYKYCKEYDLVLEFPSLNPGCRTEVKNINF